MANTLFSISNLLDSMMMDDIDISKPLGIIFRMAVGLTENSVVLYLI